MPADDDGVDVSEETAGEPRFRMDFAGFLDWNAADSAECCWWAAISWIERACRDAHASNLSRFRHYPKGELRRLQRDIERGLELAGYAVHFQDEENRLSGLLNDELHKQAIEAGKKRRRAQTLPAEKGRLEKARRRREAD